ncbi:MAG: hypothetical protein WAO18_08710, partial [Mycobacterium sp.]
SAGGTGGAGGQGNVEAGLNSTGTAADHPSANGATATGGNGGTDTGAGHTGGTGGEADVLAQNTDNLDGTSVIGTPGGNNP